MSSQVIKDIMEHTSYHFKLHSRGQDGEHPLTPYVNQLRTLYTENRERLMMDRGTKDAIDKLKENGIAFDDKNELPSVVEARIEKHVQCKRDADAMSDEQAEAIRKELMTCFETWVTEFYLPSFKLKLEHFFDRFFRHIEELYSESDGAVSGAQKANFEDKVAEALDNFDSRFLPYIGERVTGQIVHQLTQALENFGTNNGDVKCEIYLWAESEDDETSSADDAMEEG